MVSSVFTNVWAAEGLNGVYYNPPADTTNWWNWTPTLNYLATNPTPAGHFVATNINYGTPALGGDKTSITTWLGSDATSFTGSIGNMSDGVITLNGYIDLSAGVNYFEVTHDDGAQLNIDGQTVVEASCCGTTDGKVSFNKAGWHTISLAYNNAMFNNYHGQTYLNLKENGSAINLADLSTTPVPEPEEWAMLMLGLPLLASTVRRKQN